MASTVATIINGATVGAVATNSSNISKLTFTAGSTHFALQGLYTPSVQETSQIAIRYAQSIDDLAANAAAVARLRYDSRILELPKNYLPAGAVHQVSSDVIPIKGICLIVWTEEVVLKGAATLTVKSIEYPNA